METLRTVSSQDEWRVAVAELGQDDNTVVAWRILNQKAAYDACKAMLDKRMRYRGNSYIAPCFVPEEVQSAAYDVAEYCSNLTLGGDGKLTASVQVLGDKNRLTELHADLNLGFQRDVGIPPLSTLYVMRGEIEAFYRLLPLSVLSSTSHDELLALFENWQIENHESRSGFSLNDNKKPEFLRVVAPAGTILAFPAAGSIDMNIRPSAHEVNSLSDDRLTLPMYDKHFARYDIDRLNTPGGYGIL